MPKEYDTEVSPIHCEHCGSANYSVAAVSSLSQGKIDAFRLECLGCAGIVQLTVHTQTQTFYEVTQIIRGTHSLKGPKTP